jgi:cytoskeletal protein CcmA (bactofilin family)
MIFMFKASDTAAQEATVIGAGVMVEGDIKAKGDVVIVGALQGSVTTEGHIQILESAQVKATVTAGSLFVAGEVVGTTVISQKTELTSTGNITGELTTGQLVVAEGGQVQGSVTMRQASPTESN